MVSLQKIEAKYVRGIGSTGPALDLQGKCLVLLGENGVGKSSYVDVLEYSVLGECSSLDIGKKGVSWNEGGAHIKAPAGETKAAVVLSDGQTTFSLSPNTGLPTGAFEKWVHAAKQKTFLLRRRSLLRLIEAEPKGRYDALAPFLSLHKTEALEASLNEILGELETREATSKVLENNSTDVLRRLFAISPSITVDRGALIAALNGRLWKAGFTSVNSLEEARKLQAEVAAEMKNFSGTSQAGKLQACIQLLSAIPSIRALSDSVAALNGMFTELSRIQSRLSKAFSVEVLEHGKHWILQEDLRACPLCEQALGDRDGILNRIDERIKDAGEFKIARDRGQKQRTLSLSTLIELGRGVGAAHAAWKEATSEEPSALQGALQALRKAVKVLDSSDLTADGATQVYTEITGIDLEKIIQDLVAAAKERLAKLGDIARFNSLSDANQVLAAFTVELPKLLSARDNLSQASKAVVLAKTLKGHAMNARKRTVQTIVNEIAQEANTFFAMIHPGEALGGLRMTIPERGQGSVDMDAEFHQERGDARLYFSESHLDTLGISIFLAMRKRQFLAAPHFNLLVLDDVFHSVDADHRERVARLLIKHFGDHQLVITTHDPIWFEWLQRIAEAEHVKDRFIFKRISDWSIDAGPQFGDFVSDFDFLSAGDFTNSKPEDICIRAGRLLEEVLKNLCHLLEIAVRFNIVAKYDLGTLWPPFAKRAKENQGFAAAAGTLIDELNSRTWIRNKVGAHSNETPAPLTMDESKRFASDVLRLIVLTRCSEAHYIQRVQAPEGNWVCKCGLLNYAKKAGTPLASPLVEPSSAN